MSASRLFLGPGASGTIERLRPYRDALVRRHLDVELVPLPKGRADRAVPVYRDRVGGALPSSTIGGHSFGGRVASLLAAHEPPAALVLLSFPLHAPGRQASWDERTAHFPRIACPVLLLSGESDPFADLALLQRAVDRLPDARLRTWPRVGHGLGAVLDEAMEAVATFIHERT
jgi:pimeloyl-ACP methyl ester carboxylesterase